MVRIIPFGELQETWPVIGGGAIFLLFIVCSADLDIHCDRSFSHHVKFYSFMIPPGWFVSVVSTLCLLFTYEWSCDGTLEHQIVEPLMSISKTKDGENTEPL